jgi:hypothetical protein
MCAWRAAPWRWQMDGFSSRDAHAFNRNSSLQVTECVDLTDFPLVTGGFSAISSPSDPSFHFSPLVVLFELIEANSAAQPPGPFFEASQSIEQLNREVRLPCSAFRAGVCTCVPSFRMGTRICQRHESLREQRKDASRAPGHNYEYVNPPRVDGVVLPCKRPGN